MVHPQILDQLGWLYLKAPSQEILQLSASELVNTLISGGYDHWLGIPCSYLGPVLQTATEHSSIHWHNTTRESDTLAFACGLYLGGKSPVVLMQNSGLLNALDALSSLVKPYKIPLLLIVSHRGCPSASPDAEHHHTTGRITEDLLDLLQIPHQTMHGSDSVETLVNTALDSIRETRSPYVFLVPQHTFQPVEASAQSRPNDHASLTRLQALKCIDQNHLSGDLIVTTNGYTTREWLGMGSQAAHFPVVGSMGCASALGLGWATAQPHKRITVIDGDGSFLMGLTSAVLPGLTTALFRHIVLDNGRYESTGNQETGLHTLDLAAIAQAMGYPSIHRVSTLSALQEALTANEQLPCLIHVQIKTSSAGCPRPRPSVPLVHYTDNALTLNADRSD